MSSFQQDLPILYSFRRCPYAMRARLALMISKTECELREVLLRDKPESMLAASAKGTVPVLIETNGEVLDESLDVMLWALNQSDPDGWLQPESTNLESVIKEIERFDLEFKPELDRYKYSARYDHADPLIHRQHAAKQLELFNEQLTKSAYLTGTRPSLLDMALVPFIRQFANTDKDWFFAQPWTALSLWLRGIIESNLFINIMKKYPRWMGDTKGVRFPG